MQTYEKIKYTTWYDNPINASQPRTFGKRPNHDEMLSNWVILL